MKREELMCTLTKYRESVPRIRRREMTSCMGRWEGMERRWKGSYQGNMEGVVLELALETI